MGVGVGVVVPVVPDEVPVVVFPFDAEVKDEAGLAAPQPAIPSIARMITANVPRTLSKKYKLASVGGGNRREA